MEISITQFRRDIFALINKALEGQELWVTHKGRRVKIVPESIGASRLSRITALEVINPDFAANAPGGSERSMQEEMVLAWERDWSTL